MFQTAQERLGKEGANRVEMRLSVLKHDVKLDGDGLHDFESPYAMWLGQHVD